MDGRFGNVDDGTILACWPAARNRFSPPAAPRGRSFSLHEPARRPQAPDGGAPVMACPLSFCGKRCFARLGDAPPFMRVPFRSGGRGKRCLTGGCLSQAFFRIRFLRAPLRWRNRTFTASVRRSKGLPGEWPKRRGPHLAELSRAWKIWGVSPQPVGSRGWDARREGGAVFLRGERHPGAPADEDGDRHPGRGALTGVFSALPELRVAVTALGHGAF